MADWTIRLPYEKPPLSLNDRGHWRRHATIVRNVRADVAWRAQQERIPHCQQIHVQLVYVPRDGRRRDPENLVATQKALIDGLVSAAIVPDDTPDHVTWSPPVIAPPDSTDPHLYLEITRKDT